METLTVKEIAKACKGRLLQGDYKAEVKGVFTDSRLVNAGGAFFALKGERADGHDFISQAAEKGCSLAVIEDIPDKLIENLAYLEVKSTEDALGDLALYYLEKFPVKKIGVTGSTGKTTTKEMLFLMLSKKYKTLCNEGNYNNLIGLPLTVFRLDGSYEAAVFEMGMDRLGEIHRMAEIVKPHLALVTNVGLSHLSKLENRDNISKAKGEIRDFLIAGDALIINGDDQMMRSWARDVDYEIITVGQQSDSDAVVEEVYCRGEAGVTFAYSYRGSKNLISLSVPGMHNAMNAAMALTAALKLGVDIEPAREALAEYKPNDMRLNIIDCGDFKLIDDTYNASPDSMKAAIDVLTSIEGNRKMAILGDMFELGRDSAAYHREIGDYAFQKGLDVVLSVGENAREIAEAFKEKSMMAVHFQSKEMLLKVLQQWVRKGDIILIKGSRGMAMEEIVQAIKAMKID